MRFRPGRASFSSAGGLHAVAGHGTIDWSMTKHPPISRAAGAEPAAISLPLDSKWERALTAGFLIWTFCSLIFPLFDTDFWWHLKTGEMILERGQVPIIDWFTYTDSEQPWVDLHWGFQLLITFVYRLGGVNLVILVKAAVITAAVGVAWFASGRELPAWFKVLPWGLAVITISGRGFERPEMLSQLFLAIWMYVAFRVERQPRLIWVLPPLQLLWTNCHALFVLGLVVGGAWVLDAIARDFAMGRFGLEPPAEKPSARSIIRAGGLVIAACFANPYFESGALFPLTIYRKFTVEQDFYSQRIGEFQQPFEFIRRHGIGNIYLLAEIGIWVLTAASFVWMFQRTRRWSVLRVTLFAAFSHLAWEATRNTNIFSLVSMVVLWANVADGLRATKLSVAPIMQRRLKWWAAAFVATMIAFVISGVWNEIGEGNKPFRLGESEKWFIHDAAKFAGREGFPLRAFVANNGQAAVYIYHNAPERKVFMDGRLEVCTLATFQVYDQLLAAMSTGQPQWQALFTQGGGELPVVILDSRGSRDAINGMANTPGWKLVFADESAAVFVDNKTAEKLKLEAADPTPLKYPPGTTRRGRG